MSYKLTYLRMGCVGFNSEKQDYEEGEPVKVTYFPLGTDTCYSFHADADDVNVDQQGDVATITFTMPAHDVEVTCSSRPLMGCGGTNNGPSPGLNLQMMSMIPPELLQTMAQQTPVSAQKDQVVDSEWTCPICQSANKGRFCCECGTPRGDN